MATVGRAAPHAIKRVSEKLLLGTCVPCIRDQISKIRVRTMTLDERLLAFFDKEDDYFAYDPKKICKTGDLVLIKQLPERISLSFTHQVLEVLYPLGNITDPVTGRKVIRHQYRDEVDSYNKLFGEPKTKFDFEKAKPRGWQENKKDFTARDTQVKFHNFEDDPYGVPRH